MNMTLGLLELFLSHSRFHFTNSKILIIIFSKFKFKLTYYLYLKQMNISFIFTDTLELTPTLKKVIITMMRKYKYKGCILYAQKQSIVHGKQIIISRSPKVREYANLYEISTLRQYAGLKFVSTEMSHDNDIIVLSKYYNCKYINIIGGYRSEGNFFKFVNAFNKLCSSK